MKRKIMLFLFFLFFSIGISKIEAFSGQLRFYLDQSGTSNYIDATYTQSGDLLTVTIPGFYVEPNAYLTLASQQKTLLGWSLSPSRSRYSLTSFSHPAPTGSSATDPNNNGQLSISEAIVQDYYNSYASGGRLNLYAVWSDCSDYGTNSFYIYAYKNGAAGGGGTRLGLNSVNKSHSTELIANAYPDAGYKFVGWYQNGQRVYRWADVAVDTYDTYSNLVYSSHTCEVIYNDIYLEARFEATTYQLTINPNGGKYNNSESNTTKQMADGETYTVLEPTRDNYIFTGWTANPSSTFNSDTSVVTMGTSNITLKANWIEKYHTLTINPDGGTYEGDSNPDPKTVEQGKTYSISDPVRNNYRFTGWVATPSTAYNSSDKSVTVNGEIGRAHV